MHGESLPPKIILEFFSLFEADTIKHLDKILPSSHPDVTYNVYIDESNNRLFTHVMTDHPDPRQDSKDLQRASMGRYRFQDIVIPGMEANSLSIVDNDDFDDDFFVKEGNTYHYIANTESLSVR